MRMFQEQEGSRPISPPRSRSSSLAGCREPPQDANNDPVCLPELYDTRHVEGAAGFKYCTKDESFVSLEWLERVDQISKIEGGKIFLEWIPHGTDMDKRRTFETRFTVLEELPCDFLMGRKNEDRDFNRKTPFSSSPPPPSIFNHYHSHSDSPSRLCQRQNAKLILQSHLRPRLQLEETEPSILLQDKPQPPRRTSHSESSSSQRSRGANGMIGYRAIEI
ncbi:hypothetical protein EYC80_009418 [Monilinia laxa]|uniref:Uncharacterized protein n=1 Tax=Monilinia laxa TaxID=61186 RepID=A0A5N6JXV8_MONLA|nr:hypothetical protein EYC80_009418 [Monilinia laxa]